MSQMRQQRAYRRGIWAAHLWKRPEGTILRWDKFCVSKAYEHNLPAWLGHIPIIMIVTVVLVALVFGGMLIASITLIIAAITLLSLSIFEPKSDRKNEISPFEYKAYGEFGPGWYSGKTKVSNGDSSPYDYRGNNSDG